MCCATSVQDFHHILFPFTATVHLKVGYWSICFVFGIGFPLDVDVVDGFGIFAIREVDPAVSREVIYKCDEV